MEIGAATERARSMAPDEVAGYPVRAVVAPATRSALFALVDEIRRRAPRSQFAYDTNVDLPNGLVEVFVADDEGEAALRRAATDANADRANGGRAVVRRTATLARPNANIWGGLALTTCTSGFSVVMDSTTTGWTAGTRGVLTASHCSNSQSRNGVSLPFLSAHQAYADDYQIHSAPGFTVGPYFFEGSMNRQVTGYDSTLPSIGDYVCKYGKTLGYNCGTTYSTNYSVSYVAGSCSCWPIAEHVSNQDMSADGDSGGPVFLNYTAFGIVSGAPAADGNDLIYEPTYRLFVAQGGSHPFHLLT